MSKPTPPTEGRDRSDAERFGHLWAAVYVGIIVLLAVVLVGKAFLGTEGG